MISVCMATYNGEDYLIEQIESILKQLNSQDELIIQDDCSTDDTVEIIKSLNDKRIKLAINEKNVGYQMNFSKAIERASGDLIFLSDQDDVWLCGKIKTMSETLNSYDVVVSNAVVVDNYRNRTGTYFSQLFIKLPRSLQVVYSVVQPRYLGCCIAFKRECIGKIIPLPKELGEIPHDYYIGTYLFLFFKAKFLDEPLIEYRRHGMNVSNGKKKSSNSIIKKITYRAKSIYLMVKANHA